MKQYIDKAAVVTEIKKLMGNPELIEDWRYRVKMEEKNELLKSIINIIDTLKVKQVDSNDAFIEKACEWLKENITNNPNADSVLVRNGCVTLGMLIEDFKKYMKGE